jgi:hypothetical protein
VTLAAGIDVGNATTEVVLGRVSPSGVEVVAAGRVPTRRLKGSPESLTGAVALVRRLERTHGVSVDRAVVAPLRPVSTRSASVPEDVPDTGRLRWLVGPGSTTGGAGFGVGRPWRLGTPPYDEGPLVALVTSGTGYTSIARELAELPPGRLAAVLVEDDEGVLVANRLPFDLPVVDEVPVARLLDAELVAAEVSSEGRPLRTVTDPLKLVAALGLSEAERAHAATVASMLFDATHGVVAVGGDATAAHGPEEAWIELDGSGRLGFLDGARALRSAGVGAARCYAVPGDEAPHAVDDLWAVDLAEVATVVQARRGAGGARPVTLAALTAAAPVSDPAAALRELLGVPVRTVHAEAVAARAGGLSTPGAGDEAVVVDLGGGTIDAVSGSGTVVAAGAGDQLTHSVASLTGVGVAAAEWVKRGPAHRVEAPQVLLAEDGGRGFLDRPAPAEVIGSLVVRGPAGLLPFSRTLAPGEWRALRMRVKVDLLGGNVARALRTLDTAPRTVVVVGGCAGDDEVLAAVAGALPAGTAVGRGEVAGTLGHRYAVAYGLLLLDRRG